MLGQFERAKFKDQRMVAMGYLSDAFEEARLDGLDADYIAHAALFAAFKELVATYGEDATAKFAEVLPERVRNGEFTVFKNEQ